MTYLAEGYKTAAGIVWGRSFPRLGPILCSASEGYRCGLVVFVTICGLTSRIPKVFVEESLAN